MVSGPVPVLLSTTGCGTLVVPTWRSANVSDVGATAPEGAVTVNGRLLLVPTGVVTLT